MKYLFFVFLTLFTLNNIAFSQTVIPNSGFENWKAEYNENQEYLYDEPDDEWWGTLNKLRRLGPSAPVTTTKTTDAHSGMYAAKMQTLPFGTDFVIPGMLLTGVFKPELYGYLEGRSFSGKPSRLRGFYKFSQVEGDSCSIYINLTKYNFTKNQKDTIAEGSLMIREPVNSYTEFIVDLNYYDNIQQPDTIKIVFISSAGVRGIGSTANAKIGNTMYLDDLSLEYPDGIEIPLMSENLVDVFYSFSKAKLILCLNSILSDAILKIYDIIGNEVINIKLNENLYYELEFLFSNGTYFYSIFHNSIQIYSGKFIK